MRLTYIEKFESGNATKFTILHPITFRHVSVWIPNSCFKYVGSGIGGEIDVIKWFYDKNTRKKLDW